MDRYYNSVHRAYSFFENVFEGQPRRNVVDIQKTRQLSVVVQPIPHILCDTLAIGIMFRMTEKDGNPLEVSLEAGFDTRSMLSTRQMMPKHAAEFMGQIADKAFFSVTAHAFPAIPT